MFHSRFALALMSALAIVSCASDPKAPNDANFTRAIDAYLEKDEKAGKLPLCMNNPANIPDEAPAGADGAEKRAVLDRYVSAGLVTRHEIMKQVSYWNNAPKMRYVEYTLTPVGQSSIKSDTGMFGGRVNHICYGTFRVGKIVNFTEPGEVNGYRVSTVRWYPHVTSVADWTKTESGKALVGQEIAAAENTEQGAMAVLMSTGWEAGKVR